MRHSFKHFLRCKFSYECFILLYAKDSCPTFFLQLDVCIVFLTEKNSINYVLEHLADANFDPEFYKLHESEIVAKFNQENNTNIQLKKKSWARIFSA